MNDNNKDTNFSKDEPTLSDIERARLEIKKQALKNKKQKIRNVIIFIVFVFIIINLLNPITFMRSAMISIKNIINNEKFPIVADYGVEQYIKPMGNDAFIITNTGQYFLNKNGNVFNKSKHNYSDVDYSVNGDKFLLYQYNNKNFIVGDKLNSPKSIDFDQNILNANISNDGKVALVLPSSNYLNELAIIDSNNKEIFRWFSANEYISSMKFSDNGDEIYVTTISTNNGYLNSNIYILDFKSTKEKAKISMNNTTIVDFIKTSDGFLIISTDRVFNIDLKSNIKNEYIFKNNSLVAYSFIDNNVAIILSGSGNSTGNTIKVLDNILKEHSSFVYHKNIDDVFMDRTGIYLTSNNNISKYSLNGKLEKEINVDFYFSDFVRVDDYLIFLGNSQIEKIKIN